MAHTNEEIVVSSLCDRIMAICNRLNKRFDAMDEREQPYSHHQPLTAAYEQPPYASFNSGVNNTGWPPPPTAPVPLQYPAPAYVTPWQTTVDPYFDNQPQPYFHYQSPLLYQPDPEPASTYSHPPFINTGFATYEPPTPVCYPMSHNWPSYMGHYQQPSTDLQKPNPSDTDGQPPDAERSRELRPEYPEVSNSASKEEISSELSDADSRVVHSNLDVETDYKVEGNQAFTMRELLNELKNGDASVNDGRESGTPHSQQNSALHIEQNNAAVELFNSVASLDEEGRSRQRILPFAARRYATALERNPNENGRYVDYLTHRQSPTLDDSPDSFLGGDGHDLSEQDQRMLNPSSLDDQKAIANLAINVKIAKVVPRSEIKGIAEVAAGGLGNLKVGEAYQDVIDEDGERRCTTLLFGAKRRSCIFDPGGYVFLQKFLLVQGVLMVQGIIVKRKETFRLKLISSHGKDMMEKEDDYVEYVADYPESPPLLYLGAVVMKLQVDISNEGVPIDISNEGVPNESTNLYGRRFPIRCAFDPGGNSSSKLLFVKLFIVSWFPP